jgi:hypothetical protein
MKFGLFLVLWVLLFCTILIPGCVGPDDGGTLTPVPTAVPAGGSEDEWGSLSLATLQAKEESREALTRAADDVQKGDTGWLVDAMPRKVQEQLGENPAISTEDADEIARALSGAKEVEMHENLILYETTYRGKTHSFYTVREWMVWKIVGF